MAILLEINDNTLVNLEEVHSITLNRNGEHGWIKINGDNEMSTYKITKEQFLGLKELLTREGFVIKNAYEKKAKVQHINSGRSKGSEVPI